MTLRRVDCFFYGLFMDRDILRENNVTAENPRRGAVVGFELKVGRRATLTPADGARSYGMVYELAHQDIARLYSLPGLTDYRPEAVIVDLLDGGGAPALCYNLVKASPADDANEEYAAKLRGALQKLGFPADYIASVGLRT